MNTKMDPNSLLCSMLSTTTSRWVAFQNNVVAAACIEGGTYMYVCVSGFVLNEGDSKNSYVEYAIQFHCNCGAY